MMKYSNIRRESSPNVVISRYVSVNADHYNLAVDRVLHDSYGGNGRSKAVRIRFATRHC